MAPILCALLCMFPNAWPYDTAGVTRVGEPAGLIRVYVFAAKPEGTLMPFDQKDREDSAKDLRHALASRLPTFATVATAPENADVTIEVIGRKADREYRIVQLRVRVGEDTLSIDGTNDDSDWSDAAGDAAKKIAKWLKINKDQIQARRKG